MAKKKNILTGNVDISVPVDWHLWPHQTGLWDAVINRGIKRACVVWHRRAGKDHATINMAAVRMFKRHGVYWHVLPTYTQGEKVIWNGMDSDGRRFIDYIPKDAVATSRNDKMLLQLHEELGGSQYQVIGGDRPDRLVGGNPIFIAFSEYALMNPMCWNLTRPIVNANDGIVIFIFTPRGHNHGYKLLEAARGSDDWYTEVLDIRDTTRPDGTPIVTEKMVEEEIRMGMPEELARQEYYCDFSAPLVGAYYGKEFDEMDREWEQRLNPDIKWRKDFPVYTSWDIGIRDTMVVWYYQVIDGWINYIDHDQGVGAGIEEYVKMVDAKPYVYKRHYAPHDVSKREVGTGTSIMATAGRLGLRFTKVPKTSSVEDDINACRLVLARCRFNSVKCEEGVEALRHYRKDFDMVNRVWSVKPVHDWTSHHADAFRTGAVMMPRHTYTVKETPRYLTEPTFDDALEKHDELLAEKGGRERFEPL